MNFAAIILAAGLSVRMGVPKQFLFISGKPMMLHSVDAALTSGLSPVIVVTGANPDETEKLVGQRPVQLVTNPDYESGMASSLTAGVRSLLHSTDLSSVDGAVILLADQPFQSPSLIQKICLKFEETYLDGARIVRPRFAGVDGHPVLFGRGFLPDLLHITGDKGARDIISRHSAVLRVVEFNEPYLGMDVDTHSDLQRARQLAQQMSQGLQSGEPE